MIEKEIVIKIKIEVDAVGTIEHEKVEDKKEGYPIKCSVCGKDATVPFKPNGDWPVKCPDCFKSSKK